MKKIILLLIVISLSAFAQEYNANNCLDGQDLNNEDVDVSFCPALPNSPQAINLGNSNESINLGAWELGTTANGDVYKYGSLTQEVNGVRSLVYYGSEESVEVNDLNLECWAKGYYRLRKILQNPPSNYIKLREAGFQFRFFQFQTDLRNGSTGYKQISSYRDHLVKWVTVIDKDGTCIQPTLEKFMNYVDGELERRGL